MKEELNQIKKHYDNVLIDQFCIMPDHTHMIIRLTAFKNGRTQFAPTLSQIIKQYKGAVTKKLGYSIWQKSFYEHIIRDQHDYLQISAYIQNNPQKLFAKDFLSF